MPAGASAEGQARHRARGQIRTASISDEGGPTPPLNKRTGRPSAVGLDWYAANLEPLQFAEVEDMAEEIGFLEGLVGSASSTQNGGMTVQLQILPAYVHDALDMVQRSTQGVLLCRVYQVPWEAFRQDTPAWAHLSHAGEDLDADD